MGIIVAVFDIGLSDIAGVICGYTTLSSGYLIKCHKSRLDEDDILPVTTSVPIYRNGP